MQPFNLDTFTHRLLGEALFYDEEFGALGTLSLVDPDTLQERYLAHYVPEDGNFLVEEATDWEDYQPTDEDDVGYALAVDSREHARHDTPEDTAEDLLRLANEHNLLPSITILFEEEEV